MYTGKRNFKEFFKYLKQSGDGDRIKKVSNKEIKEFIRSSAPLKLPEAYIEFMRYTGHGQYWIGSDYKLSTVMHLTEAAKKLLIENNFPHKLKDDDFVFWMHQGYMFYFFNLNEGNNPPVYYYDECRDLDDFVKCGDNFIDFILDPYVSGKPYPL